jgi:hypothetical protein
LTTIRAISGDKLVEVLENKKDFIKPLKEERRARIFKPARNSEQSGWSNVNVWKIELDNQQRWENPAIGWASR